MGCSEVILVTPPSLAFSLNLTNDNNNRENQTSKMEDFYKRSAYLMQEMEHREKLSQRPVLSFLGRHEYSFKNISFCLAILINLLVIFYYQ